MIRWTAIAKLNLKSIWHRFYYYWVEDFTVFICSGIIAFGFYFILNNFIQQQLGDELPRAKEIASFFVCFFTLFVSIGYIAKQWMLKAYPIADLADSLGESKSATKTYRLIAHTTNLLAAAVVCSAIFLWFEVVPSPQILLITSLVLLGFWSIFFLLQQNKHHPKDRKAFKTRKKSALALLLVRWRLWQLLKNKACILLILMAMMCLAYPVFFVGPVSQKILPYLFCFLSGIFLSCSLLITFRADMNFPWMEQNAGIQHKQIIQTYFILALLLGVVFGLIATAIFYFKGLSFNLEQTAAMITICSTPSLLIPALSFHIEPQSIFALILLIIILAFFLTTAIMIHVAFVALVPAFIWLAVTQQLSGFGHIQPQKR